MRYRGWIASVLMIALLLSSCASEEVSMARKVSQYYAGARSLQANVEMQVNLGEQISAFTLGWDMEADVCKITVLKPSEIAGLCVTITNDGQEITYEDAAIALPRTDGTTAPMPTEALYEIYSQWIGGVHTDTAQEKIGEKDCVRIHYTEQTEAGQTEVATWFCVETLVPQKAEVFYNGERVVSCTFLNFAMQTEKS